MRIALSAAIVLAFSCSAEAHEFNQELQALSMVESSGGQNLKHQMLASGMHAGTQAGGRYGIMPRTGKEFVEKFTSPQRDLTYLKNLSNGEFTIELNRNMEADRKLAALMWRQLRKTRSASQAACAWYRGAYAERCHDQVQLQNDPYVQQFELYLEQRQVTAN